MLPQLSLYLFGNIVFLFIAAVVIDYNVVLLLLVVKVDAELVLCLFLTFEITTPITAPTATTIPATICMMYDVAETSIYAYAFIAIIWANITIATIVNMIL